MRDFTLRACVLVALLLPLLAVPSGAAGAKKAALPTVVLLPVNLHGKQSKDAVASYQGAIAESLQSRYTVIAGSKVEEVLNKVMLKESQKEAECDMTRCYGAIATKFNAEFVAVVDVTMMEGDYSVSLKILDVAAGELALSRTDTCRGCKVIDVVEKLKLLAGGEKAASAPQPAVEAPAAQAAKGAGSNDMELAYWNSIKDSTNAADFAAYLESYPKGSFAPLAKSRMAVKSPAQLAAEKAAADNVAVEKAATERFAAIQAMAPKGAIEGMVYIKTEGAIGGVGFYMDKTEVTQEAYQRVIGSNPSYFKGCPTCPVEQVNWDEATAYCDKVGKKLPTELFWKFAADVGKDKIYAGTSNEDELGDYAWYDKNSGGKTHPVGEKKPNDLGLYDMSGNVWEWTADWAFGFSDKNKNAEVIGGGSWFNSAHHLRTAYLPGNDPANRNYIIGFRCSQY